MGSDSNGQEKKAKLFGSLSKRLGSNRSQRSKNSDSADDASAMSFNTTSPNSKVSVPNTPQNRILPVVETPGDTDQSQSGAASLSLPQSQAQAIAQVQSQNSVGRSVNSPLSTSYPENAAPLGNVLGSPGAGGKIVSDIGAQGAPGLPSSSNTADGSDSEEEVDDDFGAKSLENDDEDGALKFSLMMNEACEDTPSFRASAEYVDVMFRELEQWLENLSAKNTHVVAQLNNVKNSVNDVIGLFMPSVTHCSILAQDYTTLLFGRYTEAEQVFWTDLFVHAARNANEIVNMVRRLRSSTFVKYRQAREAYLAALAEHDSCLGELFRLPSNAERGAQRDATHKMHIARRKFLKASTKLVLAISEVESETSVSLLETLSRHFMSPDNGFLAYDQQRLSISVEFHRLQAAAATLRKSLPAIAAELRGIRRDILRKSKQKTSTEEPAAPSTPSTTVTPPKAPTRFGWVNVELDTGKWTVLWAYMQHGLFGFLGLSENKTAVVESSRFIACNSKFETVIDEDRRFTFRVSSNNGCSIRVQASGRHDLELWQQAFAKASSDSLGQESDPTAVSSPKSPGLKPSNTIRSLSSQTGSLSRKPSKSGNDPHESATQEAAAPILAPAHNTWSSQDLRPWNRSFALPQFSSEVVPGSDLVVAKIDDLRRDIQSSKWMKFDSTLTSRGAMDFDLKVPSVKPLPTSVQFEAVVANSYFQPDFTCNAITANLWGSTGLHLVDMGNESVAERHDSFPNYPDNYARSLVCQDMDMRCIVAQLPNKEQMSPDEIMLFVVRATTEYKGKDTPVRLYVTSRRLLVYGSWRGIITLSTYSIEAILDIESIHGVDFSTLRITVEKESDSQSASLEPRILEFKLFIDSAVLAKRKLEYVKENGRSAASLSCNDMLGELAVISIEHAETLKQHEAQIIQDLQWRPKGRANASKDEAHPGHRGGKKGASQNGKSSFASWLLDESVGEGSRRGEEDVMDLGRGMKTKLGEDNFPVDAEVLFLAMFGSRSPVFTGTQKGIGESECEASGWYRRGKRLERRIVERFSSYGLVNETRYNIQRVDQQRSDLYIVAERRAPWVMPSGDQFYTVMKYVVYSTDRGCHLQIWARTVWKNDVNNAKTESTVEQGMRIVAQAILVNVRDAVSRVHTLEEARKRYGSIKATKVIAAPPSSTSEAEEMQATRVTKRSLFVLLIHAPMSMSMILGKLSSILMWWVMRLSSPTLLLIVLMLMSSVANVVMYNRYSSQYWTTVLEQRETDSIIESLKLSPTQQSVFSRAIYTKDVDDLLISGSLWRNSNSSADEDSPSQFLSHLNDSGCSNKFAEIAEMSLWATDYGSLYNFDPRVQETLNRISETRLEYAIKRNEMLTMLRVLNHKELDELEHEYRVWLLSETRMCANVRPTLSMLNHTVGNEITSYCLSCLDDAKNLL